MLSRKLTVPDHRQGDQSRDPGQRGRRGRRKFQSQTQHSWSLGLPLFSQELSPVNRLVNLPLV